MWNSLGIRSLFFQLGNFRTILNLFSAPTERIDREFLGNSREFFLGKNLMVIRVSAAGKFVPFCWSLRKKRYLGKKLTDFNSKIKFGIYTMGLVMQAIVLFTRK
jgi:hypothetical protein